MPTLNPMEISAKTVIIQEYVLPANLIPEQLQIMLAKAGIIRLMLRVLNVLTHSAIYVIPQDYVLPARQSWNCTQLCLREWLLSD
jgi:hypothetical protein